MEQISKTPESVINATDCLERVLINIIWPLKVNFMTLKLTDLFYLISESTMLDIKHGKSVHCQPEGPKFLTTPLKWVPENVDGWSF